MQNLRSSIMTFIGVLMLLAAVPSSRGDFPLQDGDIWVMAGDSITAQHLHSNYFEAFCYARYNKIKFGFRNSGVGGHTIPTTLARFDYDIAAWKPTVVSVELGMNDQGGTPTDKFIANMDTMVKRIRGIKARPVILSASPINNGDTLAKLGGQQTPADEYALAARKSSMPSRRFPTPTSSTPSWISGARTNLTRIGSVRSPRSRTLPRMTSCRGSSICRRSWLPTRRGWTS